MVEEFVDFLPAMARILGAQGFMQELCNGFCLLADPKTGTITVDSLRKNCAALGLNGIDDAELGEMMKQADLNGDGCVDVREFCVMMIRLGPCLLENSFLCFTGSNCKPAKPKSKN